MLSKNIMLSFLIHWLYINKNVSSSASHPQKKQQTLTLLYLALTVRKLFIKSKYLQ